RSVTFTRTLWRVRRAAASGGGVAPPVHILEISSRVPCADTGAGPRAVLHWCGPLVAARKRVDRSLKPRSRVGGGCGFAVRIRSSSPFLARKGAGVALAGRGVDLCR